MYDTGIIDLRQIAENEWKAKYQGNYGIYQINITIEGKKAKKYYCSCPSDYYPCKHISMIENAIAKKIAANKDEDKHGALKPEDFIKTVSEEKLREFIITQAKYIPELYNAILLEFSANIGSASGNKYSRIIQKALASISHNENDYYHAECLNIDVLDQWLDKAKNYVCNKQYNEAILLCKACIEEYSQWMYNVGENISLYFSSEYESFPFAIISDAAEHTDKKELFEYCLAEMKKKKYAGTDFYDEFHRLLGKLAVTVDPDTFIALQDELLAGVEDKSSYEAKTILQRKINFYRRLDQKNKAWALIKENIQIESFRLKVVEKKIEKQKFPAAKKLINDFINAKKENKDNYFDSTWNGLLLDIAQKEKDIPAMRELSYMFIEDRFDRKYYQIFKATFTSTEWVNEREKLFLHYSDKKYFDDSAANLLTVENDAERLLNYVQKYLNMDTLERYYMIFAPDYPERTLEMFITVLIPYAENNMGRSYYEHIHSLLKLMLKIKGGKKVVSDLVADFRIRYKNRRAMMEILSGV